MLNIKVNSVLQIAIKTHEWAKFVLIAKLFIFDVYITLNNGYTMY